MTKEYFLNQFLAKEKIFNKLVSLEWLITAMLFYFPKWWGQCGYDNIASWKQFMYYDRFKYNYERFMKHFNLHHLQLWLQVHSIHSVNCVNRKHLYFQWNHKSCFSNPKPKITHSFSFSHPMLVMLMKLIIVESFCLSFNYIYSMIR